MKKRMEKKYKEGRKKKLSRKKEDKDTRERERKFFLPRRAIVTILTMLNSLNILWQDECLSLTPVMQYRVAS